MKKLSLTLFLGLLSVVFCQAQVSLLTFNKSGEFRNSVSIMLFYFTPNKAELYCAYSNFEVLNRWN